MRYLRLMVVGLVLCLFAHARCYGSTIVLDVTQSAGSVNAMCTGLHQGPVIGFIGVR